MLAEQWRWSPNAQRGIAHLEREPERTHPPGHRMLDVFYHVALARVWVGEDLREVMDRSGGDARRDQPIDPLGSGALSECRLDLADQCRPVRHPRGICLEAWVASQGRAVERCAQLEPLNRREGRQRDVAVARAERLVWSAQPMRRAHRSWRAVSC